jgi:pheromone shutdown-related protein TraB
MEFRNLSLIGTSHIAKQSVEEIRSFIESAKPDIVAIELDRSRFLALTSKKKQRQNLFAITRIGLNGLIFLVLGQWAQKALGKLVGMKPGAEMLAAIKLAKKHGLALALIDQDIEITLKKFSTSIPLKERLRIFGDIISGVFGRGKELNQLGISSIDLTKVPDEVVIRKLIGMVRLRYPSIYRILVEERNTVMAQNLSALMRNNPGKKILAVVGAGHETELLSLVELYTRHFESLPG